MNWIILDLDGCISDDSHRHHLAEKAKFHDYHSLCHMDSCINKEVVEGLAQGPKNKFLFVTGREEFCRYSTMAWLLDKFPWLDAREMILLMRPDGDNTPSPALKIKMLEENNFEPDQIRFAYDDRRDVLEAYRRWGVKETWVLSRNEHHRHPMHVPTEVARHADELLADMAETFRERNKVYGSNYLRVGQVMEVLHGAGTSAPASELVGTAEQFNVWHLYELMIVKLTRFANSGLKHKDSIHDMAVYAAMIESLLGEDE